mmetsp:Transcript_2196/g.4628  ORF Transcript_2196/g.4628 Transcript_2196/m.4628 type:complete len:287 (+) Transcript_2196:1814-2674(+)
MHANTILKLPPLSATEGARMMRSRSSCAAKCPMTKTGTFCTKRAANRAVTHRSHFIPACKPRVEYQNRSASATARLISSFALGVWLPTPHSFSPCTQDPISSFHRIAGLFYCLLLLSTKRFLRAICRVLRSSVSFVHHLRPALSFAFPTGNFSFLSQPSTKLFPLCLDSFPGSMMKIASLLWDAVPKHYISHLQALLLVPFHLSEVETLLFVDYSMLLVRLPCWTCGRDSSLCHSHLLMPLCAFSQSFSLSSANSFCREIHRLPCPVDFLVESDLIGGKHDFPGFP